MKIWKGYGTEHSANLVIIGTFKDVKNATEAKNIIEELTEIVRDDETTGKVVAGGAYKEFSDGIMEFWRKTNFVAMDYNDPEALLYDYSIDQEGNKLKIHTEEQKYQIILNAMIQKGAKIELFSAHDYQCEYSRH